MPGFADILAQGATATAQHAGDAFQELPKSYAVGAELAMKKQQLDQHQQQLQMQLQKVQDEKVSRGLNMMQFGLEKLTPAQQRIFFNEKNGAFHQFVQSQGIQDQFSPQNIKMMTADEDSVAKVKGAIAQFKDASNKAVSSGQQPPSIQGFVSQMSDPQFIGAANPVYESAIDQGMKINDEAQKEQMAMQKAALSQGGQKDRAAAIQQSNALRANAAYDSKFRPFDDTINKANQVLGIIQRIKDGDLKSTPTLATDLSNSLGAMFASGRVTVAGSEHASAGIQSMEGKANSKYGWFSGQPMNTITGPQLNQLEKDVDASKQEYTRARSQTFESWKKGPGVSDSKVAPALQQRYDAFAPAVNYTAPSKFVSWQGQKWTPEELEAKINAVSQVQPNNSMVGSAKAALNGWKQSRGQAAMAASAPAAAPPPATSDAMSETPPTEDEED